MVYFGLLVYRSIFNQDVGIKIAKKKGSPATQARPWRQDENTQFRHGQVHGTVSQRRQVVHTSPHMPAVSSLGTLGS